jgi:hypothetical protein
MKGKEDVDFAELRSNLEPGECAGLFLETVTGIIGNMWSKDQYERWEDTSSDPGALSSGSHSNMSFDDEGRLVISGHKRVTSNNSTPEGFKRRKK